MGKRWFVWGLMAAMICITLFALYIQITLLSRPRGIDTSWLNRPMFFTGHAYVFFLGFLYPEYMVCQFLNTESPSCLQTSAWILALLSATTLILVYFLIGASMGFVYEKFFRSSLK